MRDGLQRRVIGGCASFGASGMPNDMRDIIEGGPPDGILSKFNEMFNDKETNTHLLAEQAMQELGWKDT